MDNSLPGYSVEDFREEARDLLSRAESALAGMAQSHGSSEGVNALFRAIHSLKGSAAYAGLGDVHDFAHLYESVLGELRNGTVSVDDAVMKMLVRAKDYLEDLLFTPGPLTSLELDALKGHPLERLSALLKTRADRPILKAGGGSASQRPLTETAAMAQADVIRVSVVTGLKSLALSLKKRPFQKEAALRVVGKVEDTLRWAFGDRVEGAMQSLGHLRSLFSRRVGGNDAAEIQKYFNEITRSVKAALDALEAEKTSGLSPGKGGNEIDAVERNGADLSPAAAEKARGRHSPEDLREVSEDAIVRMTTEKSLQRLSLLCNDNPPDPGETRKEIDRLANLNRWAYGDNEEIERGLASLTELLGRPCGADLSAALREARLRVAGLFTKLSVQKDEGGNPAGGAVSAGEATPTAQRPASAAGATVRVKSEDLERLMKTVGGLRGLDVAVLEKLQSQALQLRMVPVGELFSRFPKVVRDLAERLGKDIDLEMTGESVKLDKVIADKIQEPLLHMIRNAASHGLESREMRARLGKGAGLIRVAAYHEGGQVIVEVSDNGRGIALDKVKERAIALGLLPPESDPGRKRLLDLIYTPGFSTAEGADAVSGRGVGMDVVKEIIQSLQGAITVESKEGAGTTFRLILPLTLAIVKALILEEGGHRIALPSASVDRVITMTRSEIRESSVVDKEMLLLDLKDEMVPLVSFSRFFGVTRERDKRCVVIVRAGPGHKVAIVVDAALERRPLTVQPLDRFARNRFFSSAALADENLVMILNVPSLLAA